uniref:Synaptosomal-associated protein n=1 Tax=Panagrellus redivivus TaxID=6233 RepID=A0A7E4UVM4_PANRE
MEDKKERSQRNALVGRSRAEGISGERGVDEANDDQSQGQTGYQEMETMDIASGVLGKKLREIVNKTAQLS